MWSSQKDLIRFTTHIDEKFTIKQYLKSHLKKSDTAVGFPYTDQFFGYAKAGASCSASYDTHEIEI